MANKKKEKVRPMGALCMFLTAQAAIFGFIHSLNDGERLLPYAAFCLLFCLLLLLFWQT